MLWLAVGKVSSLESEPQRFILETYLLLICQACDSNSKTYGNALAHKYAQLSLVGLPYKVLHRVTVLLKTFITGRKQEYLLANR